ncbi:ribonuclease D [Rhabdaerophilum calidifontis]|uniref:ribonuclease D n=1 Tax=Rhabdaerophilum calidifontis TaxID=2604328 RepID=UPI00123889E7|nr:ribonuclease D [Rhabdaerophilum calidifontis]
MPNHDSGAGSLPAFITEPPAPPRRAAPQAPPEPLREAPAAAPEPAPERSGSEPRIAEPGTGPAPAALPVPPLVTTSGALAEACARLARAEFVTVDTEFMRETTYYPKLCLIQMASDDEIVLVDPLAEGLDLRPFLDLMAKPAVTKVFHAARQDLEIIWQKGRIIPHPLFDSQVAAMVCGYGEQVSYESLASGLAGAKIDKSSRFTDWARRPLTEAQLAYAAADVTHLRTIYRKLSQRIARQNRAHWVAGEMAILENPRTYETHPEDAWLRVKARIRKPVERAVLIELAAWREREAQTRDVPRARVLKDDCLAEIAVAQPTSVEALGRLRALPNGFERSRAGAEILEAVQRGRARDPATIPPFEAERPGGSGALVQLLKVLLQAVAEKNHVAARLIASAEEIERLAAAPGDDLPVLQGWRHEIYGETALKLIRGEVTIGLEKGRIVTVPR